jgi:acyl-CoA oxidase
VQIVIDDPVFRLDDKYFLTREEAFDRVMQKSVHYVKITRDLKLDPFERGMLKKY